MAKYADVLRDVEELFASTAWTATGIQAYPSNYQGGSFTDEFVRVEVLPAQPRTSYGSLRVGGQIIVQIYTRAGEGTRRSMEIADLLDTVLQAKTLQRGTQTGTSSLSFLGIDNDDNSLFRADYAISFRNYLRTRGN